MKINDPKIIQNLSSSKSELFTQVEFAKDASLQEFVIFVKPEIFFGNSEQIQRGLDIVSNTFDTWGVQISGLALVRGEDLEKYEVMSAHYGYINQISKTASKTSDEDKALIAEMLEMSVNEMPRILGGHEFLAQYPTWTASELDKFWFTKKSMRLRGGFYFNVFDVEGLPTILVNAFHPSQIEHFTLPGRKILLFLGQSNKSFATLRNELIGDTYPEKSLPTSIRGQFFADPASIGQTKVDIGNNGIHMSAGPFEALKEIYNFYGKLFNLDLSSQNPNMIHLLQTEGKSYEEALKSMHNPMLRDGKDLFSVTELVDTREAMELFLEN